MRNNFGIFIMSYGTPDKVMTLESLRASKYSGQLWIVVGDDDPTVERYRSNFGNQCIVFNKSEYVAKADRMGVKATKAVLFARNACFDIAASLGLEYFQQLDDDYLGFYITFDAGMEYINTRHRIRNYDAIMDKLIEFYARTPKEMLALSFLQGGDFIGGTSENDRWSFSFLRKAMNGWLCSTQRRITFRGVMNEDVNAFVEANSTGKFMLSLAQLRLQQPKTQTTGGMTGLYKQYGTHVKSFLTVMLNPSCCKVSVLTNKQQRIHHRVLWERCGPRILRETNKKKAHIKSDCALSGHLLVASCIALAKHVKFQKYGIATPTGVCYLESQPEWREFVEMVGEPQNAGTERPTAARENSNGSTPTP